MNQTISYFPFHLLLFITAISTLTEYLFLHLAAILIDIAPVYFTLPHSLIYHSTVPILSPHRPTSLPTSLTFSLF